MVGLIFLKIIFFLFHVAMIVMLGYDLVLDYLMHMHMAPVVRFSGNFWSWGIFSLFCCSLMLVCY